MKLKNPLFLTFLAAASLMFSHTAFTATLMITSPAIGVRLPAGPDYATEVLGDPWDMANPEDISIDPDDRSGWGANFGFPGDGTVGGTTAPLAGGSIDTTIMFLNRGYYNIINPGRTGRKFPIDTTVYKKIAFKMRSGKAGELPTVYWFHTSPGDPSPSYGGMFTPPLTIGGNQIFTFDLSSKKADEGQNWMAAPAVGLRIDPNAVSAGQDVFFDWVRLTAADNAPGAVMLNISWTGVSGTATVDVVDASNTVLNIASGVNSPLNWNYGILPPGAYQLRVTTSSSSATTSFTINNPPLITVTDPNETDGEDFATTVLSNPWDMNDSADVAATSNVTDISFSGGVFSGTNAPPTMSDPNVILHNSSTTVIDTSKYRFLTYRMQLDGPYDLGQGSVARVFWSSTINADASLMTTTKDIIAWPGTVPGTPDFVTYTIDLGQLSTVTNGGLELTGTQQVWSAANIRHFRIDPNEFTAARSFHIDYVRLAAMREARNGSFVIRYVASDADPADAGATVKLYYAPDKNPANRQLIVSSLPLSADGQYMWDTSSVAPGIYYIYGEVNDGLNTNGLYSHGQLRVAPLVVPDPPTNLAVVFGPGRATISFTAPQNNGGSIILSYIATCTAAGQIARTHAGLGSPITVSDLTGGVTYSCTVTASNSAGLSFPATPVTITPLPNNSIVPILMMLLFD